VVAVKVYVVVVVGLAVGLEIVALLKPVDGDHAYVTPATAVIPINAPLAFVVHVLVKSVPAFAVGGVVLTVTTT
jgi:hypothetical protein